MAKGDFLQSDSEKKITDELIGKDEKVCSCSVRIAELLRAAADREGNGTLSLARTLAALRRKNDKQREGE